MKKINGRQAAVAGLAMIAMVGGGVGIASASGAAAPVGPVQQQAPDPGGAAAESETSNPAEEVDGVDCENGIDSVTGLECDGGPAANPQDGAEGPEAADSTG
jgi:hypothetical protein